MSNWVAFVRQHLSLPELTREREERIVRELADRLEDCHRDALLGELTEQEADARAVRPGQNPFGKRIARGRDADQPVYATVVGVVENLRITELTGEPRYQVYLPYSQFSPTTMSLVVRTKPDLAPVMDPMRATLRSIDADPPLFGAGRLDQTASEVVAPQRLTSVLMILFAATGMVLALVGVFGVISYSVNQRTRELGIRLALGARPAHIYGSVLGTGLKLAALGVAVGMAGAAALSRTIEGLLFGVSATHPATYVVVPLVLVGAVLLACHLSARRAARVDPVVALRCA